MGNDTSAFDLLLLRQGDGAETMISLCVYYKATCFETDPHETRAKDESLDKRGAGLAFDRVTFPQDMLLALS